MLLRRLGKTELSVSVVGVGTWQFGGEWGRAFTPADAAAIFDAARDVGINLIDTAECYGDHLSESLVGQSIERDRAKWIVATKFGHVFHGPFDRTDERSAVNVVDQVEKSLRALRTDYIDLLQYHSVRDDEFFDRAVRDALHKLVQDGKVRFVGNSIGNAGPGPDGVNAQANRSRAYNVTCLQVIYNRLDRKPEEGKPSVFDIAADQDLGILARVPLASGLLSGKYQPGATFPKGDVRERHNAAERDEKLRLVQQIAKDEVPAGVKLDAWALAWCLKNPAVSAVIPGCKSPEQVRANAAAAELVKA